ncbi:MAG: fatty acid desaturase CarF family protein [Vulcanimicrobiota bacterium]
MQVNTLSRGAYPSAPAPTVSSKQPETAAPQDSFTPKNPDYKTPLMHKLAAAAVVGTGAWVSYNVLSQIAAQPGIGAKVAAGAMALGGAAAGYVAADFGSGIFHHWVDNYPNPDKPGMVGKMAREFIHHHYHAHDMEEVSLTSNLWNAGRFLWAPMGAMALANPHYAVASAGLAFLSAGFMAQGFHRWAHMDNPPALAKVLQKVGLAQTPENHNTHHRPPWDQNYCIVNGMWNETLAKNDFWRKWEVGIQKVTGAEPNSWKDPSVKSLALGEITHEEFLAHRDENRKAFIEKIKEDGTIQRWSKA